jgi:hypothetical protein
LKINNSIFAVSAVLAVSMSSSANSKVSFGNDIVPPSSQSIRDYNFANDIIGQTSTGTVISGGNPIYVAPKPAYSGVVGLLMNYGAAGSFVCSGSLIKSDAILTAAHCVFGPGNIKPVSMTAFFYGGSDDPTVYTSPAATQIAVSAIISHPLYTNEVVDENDIAVVRLASAAPAFAPIYALSDVSDLTGVDHIIAGYGLRSISGGTLGTLDEAVAGTGRLRYAGNRFDFRFGDPDWADYWTSGGYDHWSNVWISDFDNGTGLRDGSCNLAAGEGFTSPVFTSDKYCNTGIGAFEGIGAGGDSGSPYFVDGKIAAVHSFAFSLAADETANRFGQLKGSVSTAFHRDFILANVPEPGTWAMLVIGFGFVGTMARRQARATA